MDQIEVLGTEGQYAQVRRLLDAYRSAVEVFASAAEVSACFDDMQTELLELRSFHGPPGFVLLAVAAGQPVGCVALRALAPGVGEVRRLFVTDAARSTGLGRRLTLRLVDEARAGGVHRLVLNTLPTMVHARALYAGLGFTETEPYVDEPTPGVHYLAVDLGAPS